MDLKTINGKKFMLKIGEALQQDWNQYGEESFEFEVLEELTEEADRFLNKKKSLQSLEEKWI